MADPRPLLGTYSLYIDGRWVGPESGRYNDISPASEATMADLKPSPRTPLSGLALARIINEHTDGGFKQSGLAREGGGLPGLHRYMEPKAIGIPA